jgi:hypothetical protein
MTKEERRKILALPRQQRVTLMLDLWRTLEPDEQAGCGISADDERELDRRADDIERHPERFLSGEEAHKWMGDLRRRLRAARRKAS